MTSFCQIVQVLLRKCEVLYDIGSFDQFVDTVSLLLSRHFINIRSLNSCVQLMPDVYLLQYFAW